MWSRSTRKPAIGHFWTSFPACVGRQPGRPVQARQPGLTGEFATSEQTPDKICLRKPNGTAVTFTLLADGGTLEIRYEGKDLGDIRVLDDALAVTRPRRAR